MKRITSLVLCLLYLTLLCGCSAKETVSQDAVTINLPIDNSVNGYRLKTEDKTAVSKPTESVSTHSDDTKSIQYCANTNSMKFHLPDCSSVKNTKEENKLFLSDRNELIELGYEPCKRCEP